MKWYEKLKSKPWFSLTMALCIAVVLYFILQHISIVGTVVSFIWNIVSPLALGVIIAYIIDPLIRLWDRTLFKKVKTRSLSRILSLALSFLLILAAMAALLYLLIPQLILSLETLINNLQDYVENLKEWMMTIGGGIFANVAKDINFENLTTEIVNLLTNLVAGGDIINAGISVGSGVVGVFISAILSVYFLLAKNRLVNLMKRVFRAILKEKRYEPFEDFCSKCNVIIIRYIVCSLLDALLIGSANAILMLIFGMEYIPIVSVVVGVTNLAPTFGPIIGGAIGAFLLLMINPWHALIFIIITIVLQCCDAYIIKPKLFSGQLGISPVLTLVSIIVFGRLFGVIGMLFAIPLAAIIQHIVKLVIDKRNQKKEIDS